MMRSTSSRTRVIRAQEPCVAAGAMVIALASLTKEGINYQQCLHVTAIDLHIVAVHMAYVAMYGMHIPARDDTATHSERNLQRLAHVWHVMGFWDTKLAGSPIVPTPAEIPPPTHAEQPTAAPSRAIGSSSPFLASARAHAQRRLCLHASTAPTDLGVEVLEDSPGWSSYATRRVIPARTHLPDATPSQQRQRACTSGRTAMSARGA